MEQFEMKLLKPHSIANASCVSRNIFVTHAVIFQMTFVRNTSESTSMLSKCVQIKPLRGRSRNGEHSLLMFFSEKKWIKAKTFIQQRKSHYVEWINTMIMSRISSVCPFTFWCVSITYQVISFFRHCKMTKPTNIRKTIKHKLIRKLRVFFQITEICCKEALWTKENH